MKAGKFLTFIMAGALIMLASCGNGGPGSGRARGDVPLMSIRDSVLYLYDITSRIPHGISAADSTRMFAELVDKWIEDRLLADVARENIPNIEEIDRLTAIYRNQLIIQAYRDALVRNGKFETANADSIRSYYERNKEDLRLSGPIIKGIYIKIPENAAQKEDVRRWVFSATPQSVDRLEKYGLKGAMQYDYFASQWIDWRSVEEQIPFDFGDPDKFVRNTVNFETTADGSTYLLHIYDFIGTGEVMPQDYATPLISEILMRRRINDYDRRIVLKLYNEAAKAKEIKIMGYNPVNHEVVPAFFEDVKPKKQEKTRQP